MLGVYEKWSYANAAVDETSPEAGGLQVRVFLRAGDLDAPHLFPGVVQLHVDRVDARVVGRHRIAHVSGDPMLLEDENTWVRVRRKEKKVLQHSSSYLDIKAMI